MNKKDIYKESLEQAQDELEELSLELVHISARRTEIMKRAKYLRDLISVLSRMYQIKVDNTLHVPSLTEVGLTEAIRTILELSPDSLTILKIREGLKSVGFDIKKYKNPLAMIHTTVKRMPDIEETTTQDGKKAYKPINTLDRILNEARQYDRAQMRSFTKKEKK